MDASGTACLSSGPVSRPRGVPHAPAHSLGVPAWSPDHAACLTPPRVPSAFPRGLPTTRPASPPARSRVASRPRGVPPPPRVPAWPPDHAACPTPPAPCRAGFQTRPLRRPRSPGRTLGTGHPAASPAAPHRNSRPIASITCPATALSRPCLCSGTSGSNSGPKETLTRPTPSRTPTGSTGRPARTR